MLKTKSRTKSTPATSPSHKPSHPRPKPHHVSRKTTLHKTTRRGIKTTKPQPITTSGITTTTISTTNKTSSAPTRLTSPQPTPSPITQSHRHYDIPRYTGFRNAFDDQLRLYAQQPVTPVSLHHFLHWPINHIPAHNSDDDHNNNLYGFNNKPSLDVQHLGDQQYSPEYQAKIIENAQFLWRELPVRLAKRVVELENLPYGLSQTPQFLLVRHWFESSFRDVIQQLPPIDPIQERNFTRVLNAVLNRHRSVIPTLAQGVLLQKPTIYKTTGGVPCPFIKTFLDSFYASRISLRMLIAQHIALHKPIPGFCGTIHLELDPVTVIRGAAAEVSDLCDRTYGKSPDINIFTTSSRTNIIRDETFPHMDSYNPHTRQEQERAERKLILEKMSKISHYSDYKSEGNRVSYVSSHLHHMVFEVLKNSARAHAEHYANERSVPDINVFVSFGEGDTDVSIKISDVGGGIPLANQSQLFSYLFTTADSKVQDMLKRFDITGTINRSGGLGLTTAGGGGIGGIAGMGGGHDDHITMLAPSPAQLSRPLSIRSKTGLMSISNSSILGPTEGGSSLGGIVVGNGGGGGSGGLGPNADSTTTTTANPATATATAPNYTQSNSIPGLRDKESGQVGSSSSSSPSEISKPTDTGIDDGGVFLIANEQQGLGSGQQRLAPLSGFGYGLALSKLFAKFGNGDLQLYSSEGHGTDAFLTLHKALAPGQKFHDF